MSDTAKPAKRNKVGFTALEIAEQVDQVRQWLAFGYRPFQIRLRCAERWGLATRTAEDRISQARKTALREISAVERQEKAAQILDTIDELMLLSRETRQTGSAVGLLRLQAELLGLSTKNGG